MSLNAIILMCTLIGGIMQQVNFGSSVSIQGTVKQTPFQAEFQQRILSKVSNGQSKEYLIYGVIYRDSNGRLREDTNLVVAPGQTLSLVIIKDPVLKVSYVLDVMHKIATKEEFPITDDENIELLNLEKQMSPENKNKNFRTEYIEGFLCQVLRIKGPKGEENEFWFSGALKAVLLEKRITETEEKTLQLVNIRRIEPDSKLFMVPTDYKYQ